MSRDDLRVATAHLGDLAVHQGRAAAEIRSARLAVEGVDAAVRNTHGSIASATVSAVEAVLSTRRNASTRMAAISDELCDKLTDAATRYDLTDDATGSALDAQMPAEWR
jgi:Excreted virulence factor EspC, type VII ESX diderm